MGKIRELNITRISDTHCFELDLPGGDVLVHAGDLTMMGGINEVVRAFAWLERQAGRYERTFLIAGNHDFLAQHEPGLWRAMLPSNVTSLEDDGAEFRGVRFWGTPWTPPFQDWAFMEGEAELKCRFARIPQDTHVLITHGPAWSLLDGMEGGQRTGSYALLERLSILGERLRLHVHGHIHGARGRIRVGQLQIVNASICDEVDLPLNSPIIVDLECAGIVTGREGAAPENSANCSIDSCGRSH